MELASHFRMLARYNRIANERLYATCANLEDAEYRKQRPGSFGSIHALLNHILLGDRIWLARFVGDRYAPPLATILYHNFAELRLAREEEDARIERFFEGVDAGFFARRIDYVNSEGKAYQDAAAAVVAHLFNHQTHHRGQVHVMLSQAGAPLPSLDMHRILNP